MKENKKLICYMIIGVIFTSVMGTLSHFVYQWTGENVVAGFFSPVNESVWEHMKLLFFPMLLYGIYASIQLKKTYPCIISGFCTGILAGTFFIPVFFYIYTGILGKNYMALDIITFLLAVLLAFFCCYRLTVSCRLGDYTKLLEVFLFVLLLCFLLFTYFPPGIGLFQSP